MSHRGHSSSVPQQGLGTDRRNVLQTSEGNQASRCSWNLGLTKTTEHKKLRKRKQHRYLGHKTVPRKIFKLRKS